MHDHKEPRSCIFCAIKHLGAAKVKMGEALSSSDSERRKARLLDATFEMNEAETTHLAEEYPELSQKVRTLRKNVEESVFDHKTLTAGPEQLKELIMEMARVAEDHKEDVPRGTYAPHTSYDSLEYREGNPRVDTGPITKQRVKQAILFYNKEYHSPASLADVQYELGKRDGDDDVIIGAIQRAPERDVLTAIDELKQDGVVKETPEGGYVDPPPAQALNNRKAHYNSKMLTGNDVGLVVASEVAGKATEALGKWADQQMGTTTAPLHARISTWLPLLGAGLVVAAAKTSYFQRDEKKQLAAVAYGSHLLSQGIDVAQEATAPGASFALVPVRRTGDNASYAAGIAASQATPVPVPTRRVRDLF